MTNQNNANVTCKPSTLNLERMTHEYFYPDLFVDDFTNVKIPTVDELAFLGANNVLEILANLRHEEKKFRRVQKDVRAELKRIQCATPEKIRHECTAPDGKAFSCNWRGMGYSKLPKELEKELFANDDADTYYRAVDKRMQKVHTCRFGRYIAEWCKKSPQPCESHQCFQVAMRNAPIAISITASKEADTSISLRYEKIVPKSIPQCPHYRECYGAEPFKHEGCIFAEANQQMLDDCKSYLQNQIDTLQKRLNYIEKYLHNIKKASSHSDRQRRSRPRFSLNSFHLVCGLKSGNKVVEIDKDGNVQYGVFVCRLTDQQDESRLLLNMYDGRVLKISHRLDSGVLYMPEADYNYLKTNPDFRTVWQNMACKTEYYAVTPGVVRALIGE